MGKKRKKKVYTTPKKIKHVHPKKSLNILKTMDNPRCQNCDNRMANHQDRFTCTYCQISLSK